MIFAAFPEFYGSYYVLYAGLPLDLTALFMRCINKFSQYYENKIRIYFELDKESYHFRERI